MVRAAKKQSKLQLWGVRFLRFHVLYSIANSLQSIAVQSWTLLECSSNTSIIHYNSSISKFRGRLMRSLLASSISMSACSSSTAAVFSSVGSQQEARITGRVWVTRVRVPLILGPQTYYRCAGDIWGPCSWTINGFTGVGISPTLIEIICCGNTLTASHCASNFSSNHILAVHFNALSKSLPLNLSWGCHSTFCLVCLDLFVAVI